VSFAAITFCVASERVFVVVRVHFVTDSVRKLLDTPRILALEFFSLYDETIRSYKLKTSKTK
jgi:hypothetical protein